MLPDCSGFMGTYERLATKVQVYSDMSSCMVKDKSIPFYVPPSMGKSVGGGVPLWSSTLLWTSVKFLSTLPGVTSSRF